MDTVTKYIEKHQQGVQLTLTAIAASALTASLVFGYQAVAAGKSTITKRELKRINSAQPLSNNDILIVKDSSHREKEERMDESLVKELLSRNIAFFGEDKVDQIRRSTVVVVGVGAIGSWTALMLVRSGVEHVRLVDPGIIKTSTLSRNAVAKVVDIGKSKVATMEKYLAGIAPNATVETVAERLGDENQGEILSGGDFVVDTLSNVRDKVLLARYCKENGIRLVSAMSAGVKGDPTQIQLTDINQTMEDPLARMYRRQLKKYGIDRDLPVVSSFEKPVHHGKVSDFRTRSLPVLGPVACLFGLSLTTYIIVQLGDFNAYTLPSRKMRDGVFTRMQKELAAKEAYLYNNTTDVLDERAIGYIFDELWKGKSVLSKTQDRLLVLSRWDRSKPCSYTNTICLTKEEAKVHDALPEDTNLAEHYGQVAEYIEKQFALEETLQNLWNSSLQ
ncbi:hypothetical protein K501DRAFT_254826 [Backusella circina FSU 941]|nr:hypothetical protein K501DRAFT_254826 [Backusella circina FSU 941]